MSEIYYCISFLLTEMSSTFFRNFFDAINIIVDIIMPEVIIRGVIGINNFINACLSINYIALLKVTLKYKKIF
jgi:hypothetical protein